MFICDISVFNKYGKQGLDEMLMPLNMNWRELRRDELEDDFND